MPSGVWGRGALPIRLIPCGSAHLAENTDTSGPQAVGTLSQSRVAGCCRKNNSQAFRVFVHKRVSIKTVNVILPPFLFAANVSMVLMNE